MQELEVSSKSLSHMYLVLRNRVESLLTLLFVEGLSLIFFSLLFAE